MKDLHCHLLYGIDDGSKSIEESIQLLKKMVKAGCKEIVLTPHYVRNSKYVCNNKAKEKLLKEFKERVKQEKIDVTLYLGNEIFFSAHFLDLLEQKEIATINKSRYPLFEFPLQNSFRNTGEILSILISKGYIPILAHPERYKIFQDCPDLAEEYLRMGVLMQGNYPSLYGKYGRKAKKLLRYYIKKGWISFLGSDTHHDFHYKMKRVEKKVSKLNKDKDYIKDLCERNFDKVIKDEDIAMIR